MNPLPSAPLLPDTFAPQPAWPGFSKPGEASRLWETAAGDRQPVPLPSLITRDQLAAHLAVPNAWRSLPDGTPLRLQAEGLEYILDDFGGFNAAELRSAHRVLFFATRTLEEMRALWIPPVPGAREEAPLALSMRALQAEIGSWASATFEAAAYRETMLLASLVWGGIVERLPVSAQKKSPELRKFPDTDSPLSGTCAGSSPVETPSAMSYSPSEPTSSSCSPPSSRGPTGTDTV